MNPKNRQHGQQEQPNILFNTFEFLTTQLSLRRKILANEIWKPFVSYIRLKLRSVTLFERLVLYDK